VEDIYLIENHQADTFNINANGIIPDDVIFALNPTTGT